MAIEKQLARLAGLTEAVKESSAKKPSLPKGARGSGRYGRRPDFTAISAPSTRPNSGAGVTFHFKHSFVSKKNSVSSGYRDLTSAPAHQRYIERAGAAEIVMSDQGALHEISFGTLGKSKEERAEFWRKVEQVEGRAGRVQCRMIIELPHELSPAGREKAAKTFMAKFGERGLPYWAVIHAPDEHNDRRNYHLHAVYYDRPAEQLPDGRWDFEVTTETKWNNGQKAIKRPLKQNKDPDARGKEWIRHLRKVWAATVNEELQREGLDKRHDPRAYRESGIRKMPTSHLGNKIALAESQGINTKTGAENARREMMFRLSAPNRVFDRIGIAIDKAMSGIQLAAQDPSVGGNPGRALQAAIAARQTLSAGLKAAKSREANALAADVISLRLEKRATFLDAEYDRLTLRPPKWLGEEDAIRLAGTLWEERNLIENTASDLDPFRTSCRQAARQHDEETNRFDLERRAAAAAMLRAFPALRQVLRPDEIEDLGLPLGNGPVPADLQRDPALVLAIEPAPSVSPTLPAAPLPAPILDHAAPATAPKSHSAGDMKNQPKEEIADGRGISPEASSGPVEDKVVETVDRGIPGAISVTPETNLEDMAKQLAALPSWQLRYHALATRDAADFADEEKIEQSHRLALERIETEARKRGLDLETGRLDPARAEDRKSFERHQDEYEPLISLEQSSREK